MKMTYASPAVLLAALSCTSDLGTTARPLREPEPAVDLDPSPNVVEVTLKAAEHRDAGYLYAYNLQNPGPTIRAKVGDTVQVHLENGLQDPTTIHWHGLEVPFEMDGATWRHEPVQPGEQFTYRFVVEQSGTFWYHPHFNTKQQVEAGLYGALIVDEPDEPSLEQDVLLVFDAEDEVNAGRHHHGHGRASTSWTVNGQVAPKLAVQGGTRVRVRIVNVSNSAYLGLSWPQIRVIAQDQGLRTSIDQPERVVLAPGDRLEAEVLIGSEDVSFISHPYSLNGGWAAGDSSSVLSFAVENPGSMPAPANWPHPVRSTVPPSKHPDIVYVLTGSDHHGTWFINGEQFPDVTIERAPLSEPVTIEVRNMSPTEHPFHIHGMKFAIVSRNGVPEPSLEYEDNINLRIRETVELLAVPKRAGDWMVHCHILPHAEEGMMTVLRVP